MAIKKAEAGELQIATLNMGAVRLRIIGTTPLYFHSMGLKASRTLLAGGGKKTAAEKKQLKHDPIKEFRESAYTQAGGDTLLCFPASGIKSAMCTAALETAGVTKTSAQRLITLPQQYVSVWGKPYLKMDIVRSADMAKTPDVRTRAFLPRWCAEVDIRYIRPTLSAHSVVSLLQNAGMIVGIGDFRQEKGRGSYGSFMVSGDQMDAEMQALWDDITQEARDCQMQAFAEPECADSYTQDLMEWFAGEVERRAA